MSIRPYLRGLASANGRSAGSGPRAAIALGRAWLCLDCEVVYEMGQGPCPACGSHAAWALGRLLERPAAA